MSFTENRIIGTKKARLNRLSSWSVILPQESVRSSLRKRGVQMADESVPNEQEPSEESNPTEE